MPTTNTDNRHDRRPSDKDLAKAILLEIIRQSAGGFHGSTRLYKAFYYAHLHYYQENSDVLSSWPIVHMPEGPGVERGVDLVLELRREGFIEIKQEVVGLHREDVYTLKDAAHHIPLSAEAIKAIRETYLLYIHGKTGKQLSADLHEDSRSWKTTPSGKHLNIYLDMMSDSEYEEAITRKARILENLNRARSSAG